MIDLESLDFSTFSCILLDLSTELIGLSVLLVFFADLTAEFKSESVLTLSTDGVRDMKFLKFIFYKILKIVHCNICSTQVPGSTQGIKGSSSMQNSLICKNHAITSLQFRFKDGIIRINLLFKCCICRIKRIYVLCVEIRSLKWRRVKNLRYLDIPLVLR